MAKKIKQMPIIHHDGEVERHNAYYRLNPKGHKEFVIKKDGQDEETLNELSDDIQRLLEYIDYDPIYGVSPEQPTNDRSSNQLVGSKNDQIRNTNDTITNMTASTPTDTNLNKPKKGIRNKYNTTQAESFTGTSGIAIAPTGQYKIIGDEDETDETNNEMESNMSKSIDDLLLEWEPEFKAGEYSPGDYKMPSPSGDGVAEKTPKKERVGSYETDTKEMGKPFPGKHKETAAMCDVDEDGVEHKPQGGHKSSVGEPNDGYTEKVGHNWPDKPKNSGSGVAEPLSGNRWSDGGTLTNGHAQGEDNISKGGSKLPKDGPITGTKGPQMGQPMEWSPEAVGQLLGEDYDIQSLFDNYARARNQVYVEDFQNLCDAHGVDITLDESSLLKLMDANQEFMFHEHNDSDGIYWLVEEVECDNKSKDEEDEDEDEEDEEDEDEEDEDEDEDEAVSESTISELQVRSPEEEANLYTNHRYPVGDPDHNDDYDVSYNDFMNNDHETLNHCNSCGYSGSENECPECGDLMSSDESFDNILDNDRNLSRDIVSSPRFNESIINFMSSAKSIIENNQNSDKNDIAEALNHSWNHYASDIDLRSAPTKIRKIVGQIAEKFPGFNPLSESSCDAMCASTGTAISGSKLKKSPDLADQPSLDEMEQHGNKNNPLSRDQKNKIGTPIIKGTEKGLTGNGDIKENKLHGENADILRENVNKLAKKIRQHIKESSKNLRGKHTLDFSVLVNRSSNPVRTPIRTQLVEAVTDLEEILQFHPKEDVTFETRFKDSKGQVIFKTDVPSVTINPRGPIVSEGKVIFRFQRNAELFADGLVSEGAVCKIRPHNWGSAVIAASKVTLKEANMAFRSIREDNNK